jgi:multidrug efflux system membrane fusion protein
MRITLLVLVAALTFPSASVRADDPPKGWEFVGRTQAAAVVDVQALVTGRLTRLAVKEGAVVKKGDLLAEIDPRAYKLTLDAARAQEKVAEAKLQGAKIMLDNTRKLHENKSLNGTVLSVVSDSELAKSQAKAAEAEAALMGAKAEAQRAELILSWTRLTAPFDGRVSRIQATEGNIVTANQTHLLTVVAIDHLNVTFYVPESILLRLRRDRQADPGKLDVAVGFAIDEGYPHAVKLDLIAPEVDPRTGTVRLQATLPNPEGLYSPGMTARVRLTPRKK